MLRIKRIELGEVCSVINGVDKSIWDSSAVQHAAHEVAHRNQSIPIPSHPLVDLVAIGNVNGGDGGFAAKCSCKGSEVRGACQVSMGNIEAPFTEPSHHEPGRAEPAGSLHFRLMDRDAKRAALLAKPSPARADNLDLVAFVQEKPR
jgi:hypothetical protein